MPLKAELILANLQKKLYRLGTQDEDYEEQDFANRMKKKRKRKRGQQ